MAWAIWGLEISCLVGARDFSSPEAFGWALGPTQLPVHWVLELLLPGPKWPGHSVNHSPPSNAEVQNERNCTSAPPVCLHGVNRENLPLPL